MKKRLNKAVSMYKKPVFGTVDAEKRVMALAIDKNSKKPYYGLARQITKSKGSVDIPGFIDESHLIIVKSKDLLTWKKVKDLKIKNINKILKKYQGNDKYFIGLEDPDIIRDKKNILHVYFTIAFKYRKKTGYFILLGHAKGKSLDKLKATTPVLSPVKNFRGFKEACISPISHNKKRYNLSEAQLVTKDNEFSVTVLATSKNIGKPWKYKEIAIDPRKMKFKWCKSETSPCRFFNKSFINLKDEDLLLGFINGREPIKTKNKKKIYGKFRPGLIIFNTKTGKIPWISPKHLFEDPDARTITFASDLIQTEKNKGLIFAHVNDSFIRAYEIKANELKKMIPREFI